MVLPPWPQPTHLSRVWSLVWQSAPGLASPPPPAQPHTAFGDSNHQPVTPAGGGLIIFGDGGFVLLVALGDSPNGPRHRSGCAWAVATAVAMAAQPPAEPRDWNIGRRPESPPPHGGDSRLRSGLGYAERRRVVAPPQWSGRQPVHVSPQWQACASAPVRGTCNGQTSVGGMWIPEACALETWPSPRESRAFSCMGLVTRN